MGKWMTRLVLAASVVVLFEAVWAQAEGPRVRAPRRPEPTVSVLMLSDFHFDPLSSPAKFEQLRATAVGGWQAILDTAPAAGQPAAFDALQQKCKARGVDSPWSLVRNSLQSAKLRAQKAALVVVGGDLLVHGFDCRVRTLLPEATEADVSNFAEKTVAFMALQMHRTFPGTPVYMALGNNDSGCTDYRETPGSAFLKSAGESFATDVQETPGAHGKPGAPGAKGKPGAGNPFQSFSEYGDYTTVLPAPLRKARLIVLQDIFFSARYATCGGKKLVEPEKAQIDWLREQLEEARTAREHVWVMAHIPPGVDVYSSFHQYVFQPAKLCDVKTPTMFLHSDAITETLASFPDVVQLALFSHTHMDELKLLHRAGAGASGDAVAAKLIPSISPVNGNHPAFLLAQVSAADVGMLDYTNYTASDREGTQWARSYTFRSAYGFPDFSAKSVGKLTAGLREDLTGDNPVSRTYRQYFLPGDNGLIGLGLQQIWPAYSCSASETTAEDFEHCMCPASGQPPAAAEKTTAP